MSKEKKKKRKAFFFEIFWEKKSQQMLLKPSVILKQAEVSSRREYACFLFQCLQQTSIKTQFFDNAFANKGDASKLEANLRERLNLSLESSTHNTEDFIILPPLFLKSQENAIVQLSSQLLLVLYANGPIVPVVWLRNDEHDISFKHEIEHKSPPTLDTKHDDPGIMKVVEPAEPKEEDLIIRNLAKTPISEGAPAAQEDIASVVRNLTKTPISVLGFSNHAEILERKSCTTQEIQIIQCQELCKKLTSLQMIRQTHEQVLKLPGLSETTKSVLKSSLERKNKYVQDAEEAIRTECFKFREHWEVNQISLSLIGQEDEMGLLALENERDHLEKCIAILKDVLPKSA